MTWSSFRCAVFLISACAGIANAQISSATLEGTVTDPSGGVVAGATVTALGHHHFGRI